MIYTVIYHWHYYRIYNSNNSNNNDDYDDAADSDNIPCRFSGRYTPAHTHFLLVVFYLEA